MSKLLVIAEKPSVGRDLARVLPGPFAKHEGWLEGPEHVITWAVGHLVQLAEPDEYDPKFKRWRMDDLPIVPDRFKLVVRDERSRKQMSVVSKQLARDDVEAVVNACDAGREGELIFAYLYEKARSKKPVLRLWLNSMTSAARRRSGPLSRSRTGSSTRASPRTPSAPMRGATTARAGRAKRAVPASPPRPRPRQSCRRAAARSSSPNARSARSASWSANSS